MKAKKPTSKTAALVMPRWKPEEVALLKKLYPMHSNAEIADRLGASLKSVTSKALKLGLSKSPKRLEQMGRENAGHRSDRRSKRKK